MHASHNTVYYTGIITVFMRIMSVITTKLINRGYCHWRITKLDQTRDVFVGKRSLPLTPVNRITAKVTTH